MESREVTRKIILVDDDDDLLFALNYWFSKKQFLTIALSNPDGLESSIEEFKPHLVLIDVHLKNNDGRELCKHLKQNLSFEQPVVLFSMHDYSATDFTPYQADGFIKKSSDHLQIIREIESYLF